MLIWIVTAIALIGTYLNARQNRNGFLLWMVSNTAFSVWNLEIGEYAQAFLFLCYLFLAVYGYFAWKNQK